MSDSKQAPKYLELEQVVSELAKRDASGVDQPASAAADSTLRELKAELDTLASALREPPPIDEFEDESDCCRAIELVEQIGQELTSSTQKVIETAEGEELDLGQIGPYQFVSKLGQGGMGAVYKALHTKLKRVVAIKVLPLERVKNAGAIARFEREMEAVGALQHPNIVAAHDAGEANDMHYLVMEYVDGLDLSALTRRVGLLDAADACEITRQAAIGLQEAHERKMVHRDIKPSNLMLASVGHGKQPPMVKILDLGLALLDDRRSDRRELTSIGQMMGTLDYMAPEQGDDSHDVDIRADIYSLGATLYKLLCGEAPFSGDKYRTPIKLLAALATQDAPSISAKRDDLPAELVSIVDRMLAKRPADRFGTPAEVAAALAPLASDAGLSSLLDRANSAQPRTTDDQSAVGTRDHITADSKETEPSIRETPLPQSAEDKPAEKQTTVDWNMASPAGSSAVSVSPDGNRERPADLVRVASSPQASGVWSRTGRVIATMAGFAALFAVVAVIVIQTDKGNIKVVSYDPDIEVTIKRNGDVVDGFQVRQHDGATSYFSGDYEIEITGGKPDGVSITNEQFKLTRDEDVLVEITREEAVATAPENTSPVEPMRWQLGPAEDVLPGIVQRPTKLPGIKRWQIESRRPRSTVTSVDISPDDRLIAFGTESGQIRIHDAKSMELAMLLPNGDPVGPVAWSPDGAWLASTSPSLPPGQQNVKLWRADGTPGPSWEHYAALNISWSPDGKALAIAGGHDLRVWSVDGSQLWKTEDAILYVSWSPNGELIAATPPKGTGIRLLRAEDGSEAEKLETPDPVGQLRWSPSGQHLAWIHGGKMTVRNMATGKSEEWSGAKSHLEWSPDGKFLAADDVLRGPSRIAIYDQEGHLHKEFPLLETTNVSGIDWTSDGQALAYAEYEKWHLNLRNIDDSDWLRLDGQDATASMVDISWRPGTTEFTVVASNSSGIRTFSSAGRKLQEFPGAFSVQWSPDGQNLVTVLGNVAVLDSVGNVVRTLDARRTTLMTTRWSPDGEIVACLNMRGGIDLFAKDGNAIAQIDGPAPSFNLNSLSWSPDSEILAMGSRSGEISLWNRDGSAHSKIRVTDSVIVSLDWHPHGKLIAVGGHGAKTIDVDGNVVQTLGTAATYAMRWSPNGKLIATGDDEGHVRLWNSDGVSQELGSHDYRVAALEWSGDGKQLVSGDHSGLIVLWDTEHATPLQTTINLSDGHYATISAAGEVLHTDPRFFEKEFVYTIESDDGRLQILKPSEFQKRINQSLRYQPASDSTTKKNDPDTTTLDRDRSTAEWVLSIGGSVEIEIGDQTVEVADAGQLPHEMLALVGVSLHHNKQVTDNDMRRINGLRHLRGLKLHSVPVGDQGLSLLTDLPGPCEIHETGTTDDLRFSSDR